MSNFLFLQIYSYIPNQIYFLFFNSLSCFKYHLQLYFHYIYWRQSLPASIYHLIYNFFYTNYIIYKINSILTFLILSLVTKTLRCPRTPLSPNVRDNSIPILERRFIYPFLSYLFPPFSFIEPMISSNNGNSY